MTILDSTTDIGKTILIVDDNMMSRKLIQYRVENDGFTTASAASGQEALDIIGRDPVGLVFLDLLMEGMSGLDVLARLKSNDQTAFIPVVIVSGISDANIANDCLQAGAADFLLKPTKAVTLQEIVSDLIGSPVSRGNAGSDLANPLDPDEFPLINTSLIDQLISDYGSETANGFVSRFQELAQGQMNVIIAAAEQDVNEASCIVSALKGGARTLGLARLATACRVIERACNEGRVDDATTASAKLEAYLNPSLDALQQHASNILGD